MRMTQESLGSFSMASSSQAIQTGRAFLFKVYSLFKKKKKFCLFSLFLAVVGLHSFVQASSSCSELGFLFVAMHRLLIVVGFSSVEHRL